MEVVVDSARAWRQLPDRTRERHPILADQPTAADPFPHLWKVWLPHVGPVILGPARSPPDRLRRPSSTLAQPRVLGPVVPQPRRTVILNLARLRLALRSLTEQRTVVRRPTRKRLPEPGRQVGRRVPSMASSAVTLYLTRMRLATAGACTTRLCAPLIVGGVRSTTKPG